MLDPFAGHENLELDFSEPFVSVVQLFALPSLVAVRAALSIACASVGPTVGPLRVPSRCFPLSNVLIDCDKSFRLRHF